jgi:hypothetical protein
VRGRRVAGRSWFATGELHYENHLACDCRYPLQYAHGYAYAAAITPELSRVEATEKLPLCDCKFCKPFNLSNFDGSEWRASFQHFSARGRTSSSAVAHLVQFVLANRRDLVALFPAFDNEALRL